jgi:hypothetical protein
MKTITLNQMEMVEGGKSNSNGWVHLACGAFLVSLEASFAFPVLFAFTAPLTASTCLASALLAAN